MFPHQPNTIDEITLDFINIKNSRDEKILLHNAEDKSFIIFGTVTNLEMLSSCKYWMADGTFKIVPKMYSQLFTIFGFIHGCYYPFLYILMVDKKQITYENVLRAIENVSLENGFEIISDFIITLDYELASSNAFSVVFTRCEIKRCFFHLTQSVYRKVVSCGFTELYKSNSEFRDNVKMLTALSFLPVNVVEEAFDNISCNSEQAKVIYEYFATTYIKGNLKYTTRSGIAVRNLPMYHPREWNCHDKVNDHIARSNNVQEGWHNRMKTLCETTHPNLGRFLEVLLEEMNHVYSSMRKHLEMALEPIKRRKKDTEREKRLCLLVEKYDNAILSVEELLLGVIGNLEID